MGACIPYVIQELQALGEAAGTVSRGLSADAICRLSEASFRQLKQKQQWQQQQNDAPGQGTGAARSMVAGLQTCTICLVDFEDEGEQAARVEACILLAPRLCGFRLCLCQRLDRVAG